ncbi:P-selectin-like [Ciona intestinalis]
MFDVETSCSYKCNNDYKQVSPTVTTCGQRGRWSRRLGECKKVCPAETISPDVKQTVCTNENFSGSECTYECRDLKIGKIKRTCSETGEWIGQDFLTCKCDQCYGGNECQYVLKWFDIRAQVRKMDDNNSPTEVRYGDRLISCEADRDFIFNYDCTCKDSKVVDRYYCNNYLTRNQACTHALAHLLRNLVAQGIYEEPCDLGQSYSAC